MSDQRFPYFKTFANSMGFFTINLTWSAFSVYVPIFLRNNLSPLLGDKPILYTFIGLIMVLDNIAAIIIQPYIGSVSDRTWIPKLGRRMPFIIIGLPLAALFFGLIGTFESTLYLLIIAISGFNISMAIYNTPVISLIPDSLPKEHHSQGNGVMNIVGGLANITGLLLTSYLYTINHSLAFFTSSIIMLLCLVILLINVREKQETEITESHEKVQVFSAIKQIFKEKQAILILMLFAVFFHNAGYQIAETFFSSYATDILGFQEEQAGYILGTFVVIQILLALPAGLLAKKIGALNASIFGIFIFILCIIPVMIISLTNINELIIIITLNNLQLNWQFFVYGLLIVCMGFGWILLAINLLVVVWNVTPEGKIATYTGFFYAFWHFAAIVSPFLAGGIFDLIEVITGVNGIDKLFFIVLIIYIISSIFLVVAKGVQNKQIRRDLKDKELFERRLEDKDIPFKFLPLMLFGLGLRKESSIQERKVELKKERLEIKKQIKEIKETKSEMYVKKEKVKEQKKIGKEKIREQIIEIKELREEIINQKIKDKMIEKKEKKKKK